MEDDAFSDNLEDDTNTIIFDTFENLDIDEINKLHTEPFTINPYLWIQHDINQINEHIDITSINEVKYVRDDLTHYDEDINSLPNDKGGLYFFYIKPPILSNRIQYLIYIGRAQFTPGGQNLRKRCREYFYDFQNVNKNDTRTRKVRRMIKKWGKYLYLHYIELDNNTLIDSLETLLINSLRPPFNSAVPKKIYYQPISAF